MILYRRFSGWGKQSYLIKRTTPWLPEMKTEGEMLFYNDDPKFVVDIAVGDSPDTVEVVTYPMTPDNMDIGILLEGHEDILQGILKKANDENNGQSVVTFNVKTLLPLTREDFTRLAPDLQYPLQLFLFDCEKEGTGFPFLYLMSQDTCTGVYRNLFRIQALCSRWVYKSANPTRFGKRAVFSLFNSLFDSSKDFVLPFVDLSTLNFPTNGLSEANEHLLYDDWDKLMEQSGVQKLIQTKDGITFEDEPNPMDDTPDVEVNPFGIPSGSENLESFIQSNYLDRHSVPFTAMMELGIEETIMILPGKVVIPVEMDMPQVAKKMCLYEGMVHIIPTKDIELLDEIFEDLHLIVVHENEDSYPKFQLTEGV